MLNILNSKIINLKNFIILKIIYTEICLNLVLKKNSLSIWIQILIKIKEKENLLQISKDKINISDKLFYLFYFNSFSLFLNVL